MPAPYLIQANVPVSRQITLTARWKRGNNGSTVITCFPPEGEEQSISDPLVYGGVCSGSATIYKPGFANQPLVSVSWGWDYTSTLGTPGEVICPDSYGENGGSYPETIQVYKTLSGSFCLPSGTTTWSPADVEAGSYEQDHFHALEAHSGGLTSSANIDESMEITVRAEGTFDLVCRCDRSPFSGSGYSNYGQDHDPYGPPTQYLDIYYRPKGTITLTITGPHGTEQETISAADYASTAEFEAAWAYGFGICRVEASCAASDSQTTAPSLITLLEGKFSGSGFAAREGYSADYVEFGGHPDRVTWHPGTGEFTAQFTCDNYIPGFSPVIEANRGAFGITYAATGRDYIGGGARAGTVETCETHTKVLPIVDGMTVALGSSATFESAGHYYLKAGTSYGGTVHYEKRVNDFWPAGEDGGGVSGARETYSEHTCTDVSKSAADSNLGLMDLASLGEPAFPPAVGQPSYTWYDDSRCPLTTPHAALSWTDALIFDIASECTLVDLGTETEAGDWTAETGAANITYSGGRMEVEVTSAPCRLSCAIDGWLTGARRVEIDYTGDDTDPIELELDSSVWDVTPSDRNVDVVGVKGLSTADDTQLGVSGNGKAGGLNNVTTVKLDNLRTGKTYSFKTIKGKRVTSGGSALVQVTNQGFIGSDRGENGGSDPYSGTKQLTLIVDGIYAGEALTADKIGTAGWLYPGNHGLIAMSHGTGDSEWRNEAEVHSHYLIPGIYTGTTQITVPAKLHAEIVTYPTCCDVNPSLSVDKRLRGGINVLVVDPNSRTYRARQVVIEQRHTVGGAVVDTWTLATTTAGTLLAGPFKQPIDGEDNIYTIKAQLDDLTWVSGTVEVRNRTVTQLALIGALILHGLLYDAGTGELHFRAPAGALEYI